MHRALALLPLLALVACGRIEEEDAVFIHTPIHAVTVHVDHGSVTLVAGEDEPVRVESRISSTAWNPASSHVEVIDGTLSVFASCDTEPIELCTVDHRVFVPAEIAVMVSLGSGDIVASGVEGEVVAETGAGDIDVQDAAGAFTLTTAAGDIGLSGVAGTVQALADAGQIRGVDLAATEVDAWTGTGDVNLTLVGPVTAIDARATAGAIDLRVPAGPYALDLAAEAGMVRVDRVTDDPAAAPVHAWTNAGDVRLMGE